MNEIIMEGTTALVAGMGTVFIILILISLLIGLFKYLDPAIRVEKQLAKNSKRELTADSVSENMNAREAEEENRRVVAAISVALAKSLNTTVDRLKVRAIRRF